MSQAIIDLQHLAKKFGNQAVLKDINLTVNPGEIVGLIGPSGAGKSTVIKVTLGMEVASGGSAKVFDTTMPNRELLGRIGYMAQTDALYDALSGRENLKFYGLMKGIAKGDINQEVD